MTPTLTKKPIMSTPYPVPGLYVVSQTSADLVSTTVNHPGSTHAATTPSDAGTVASPSPSLSSPANFHLSSAQLIISELPAHTEIDHCSPLVTQVNINEPQHIVKHTNGRLKALRPLGSYTNKILENIQSVKVAESQPLLSLPKDPKDKKVRGKRPVSRRAVQSSDLGQPCSGKRLCM